MKIKTISLLILLLSVISCKKDKEYPKYAELESGNGTYSLYIKDGTFEFLKTEHISYDQIVTAPFSEGKYEISGDELILKSNQRKKYIFKIGEESELIPEKMDSLKDLKGLFPIQILHNNKMPKEIGRIDSLGRKNALWLYFNEKGKVINQRLYKNGELVKDNYKSDIIIK
ncbi:MULTISPECIES: hypothetical protein [Chryseobacterium]|uniref:Lipoprotein n=1 Tax=Chryseobacterium candidae TaxID=1978493 RepID=A0ABY2R1Z6_9FLAO|nr:MULTISPECIES: hypothetical protein [Chryseobacterium]PXW16276.1 hypothetical protein C8D70_104215 [Chryseobacterium sp. CBTAP 102]THV56332.1 hypothetical protein EK417_19505 [Chryseobacterium candidae]